jgi:hypothetical protein
LGEDHLNTLNTRGNLGVLLMKMTRNKKMNKNGKVMVKEVLQSLVSPPHSLPTSHPWIKKFNKVL